MEAERDKRLGRAGAAVLFIWLFSLSSRTHFLGFPMIIICF
jgi:hypothetical protein